MGPFIFFGIVVLILLIIVIRNIVVVQQSRAYVIERLGGQCLHAKKIGFVHPDGRYLEFDSPLPEYFNAFLNWLKNK